MKKFMWCPSSPEPEPERERITEKLKFICRFTIGKKERKKRQNLYINKKNSANEKKRKLKKEKKNQTNSL